MPDGNPDDRNGPDRQDDTVIDGGFEEIRLQRALSKSKRETANLLAKAIYFEDQLVQVTSIGQDLRNRLARSLVEFRASTKKSRDLGFAIHKHEEYLSRSVASNESLKLQLDSLRIQLQNALEQLDSRHSELVQLNSKLDKASVAHLRRMSRMKRLLERRFKSSIKKMAWGFGVTLTVLLSVVLWGSAVFTPWGRAVASWVQQWLQQVLG